MARLKMLVLTTFALVLLLILAACSKSPEERTCEFLVKEVDAIFHLERGPEALANLKELVVELHEIAQEADPELTKRAAILKDAVLAADQVVTEETFEASAALGAACDSRGYDYDHFYPNQVIE